MVRPRRSQKLLNPNQPTEQQGLIFVQQVAHAMRALWRPTPNDDYGLDGELELTRGGEVTGFIIKAQVKSGASYLHNRTASGFDYYASAADTGYWAKVNFPVILVVFDPNTNSGYWVDVKPHVQHCAQGGKPVTIHFSRRGNMLSAESLLDFSALAIPDEVERTEFLVDQIRETLHSNMLPVIAVPPFVYDANYSLKRLVDASEDDASFVKNSGGSYRGFRDPRAPQCIVRAYVDPDSVKARPYPEYVRHSSTRNYAVGRWNAALRSLFLSRGLLEKDSDTFYFAPEADKTARTITWESMRGRTPDRQVAYPYLGQKTQTVAFWVHHACRAAFCEVGGCLFLRLTPAYVFTRDGSLLLEGRETGSLSTSRKSKDRNYQVLNHLMFWLWFLAQGKDRITLDVDEFEVAVKASFLSASASFGIPADKKSLIEIVSAEHDVDWESLEAETPETEDE